MRKLILVVAVGVTLSACTSDGCFLISGCPFPAGGGGGGSGSGDAMIMQGLSMMATPAPAYVPPPQPFQMRCTTFGGVTNCTGN